MVAHQRAEGSGAGGYPQVEAGGETRPGPIRSRAVLALALLALVLSALFGCSSNRACSDDAGCMEGERCSPEAGHCVPLCRDAGDCLAAERCNPRTRICERVVCPGAGSPDDRGGCPCTATTECPGDAYCELSGGAEGGRCRSLCLPGGKGPGASGCVCPPGWAWAGGACRADCPAGMKRSGAGVCTPDLAGKFPTYWEAGPGGAARWRCPPKWSRGPEGRCEPDLTAPPTVEELRAGAAKPCPSDPKGRWDGEYAVRAGLAAGVQTLYVDATAKAGGVGTRDRPFRRIQDAVDAGNPGALVLVGPGTYNWGVKIPKALHLVGRCTDGVRIQPAVGAAGYGLRVTAAPVVLEGLTVQAPGTDAPGWGLLVQAGRGSVTIRHLRVEGARDLGIGAAGGDITIESSEVRNTWRATAGRGIEIEATGRVAIRRVRVEKNSSIGVLVSFATKVEIEDSVVQINGGSGGTGRGVDLAKLSGPALIRRTLILDNSSTGVRISGARGARLEENLIRGNCVVSGNGGIEIAGVTGPTAVTGNRILASGSSGVLVTNSPDVEVGANLVADNRSKRGPANGIDVACPGGKARIVGNLVRNNGWDGIQADVGSAEVVHNLSEGNGGPQDRGRGISLRTTLTGASIRGNRSCGNAWGGILISGSAGLRIEGNLICDNGGGASPGEGLTIHGAKSGTVVRANIVRDNSHDGIVALYSSDLTLEENLVSGQGTAVVARKGLALSVIEGTLSVRANLVRLNGIGGTLMYLRPKAVAAFSGNVWSENRHAGLQLVGVSGKAQLDGERFEGNGAVHLQVLNGGEQVQVRRCGFAAARPSPGLKAEGVPRSRGIGVQVGALGLVRWVFAEADYVCSPTRRGTAPRLSGRWTTRPVRVPLSLDPCRKWLFGAGYRTDDARKGASRCARCYAANRGCRWVWEDTGVGGSLGAGLWRPGAGKVVCTDPGEWDTCVKVPSFA